MDVCTRCLLESVKSPEDLKTFSLDELKRLASEIREYLIETIPSIGGHFASNLGNVELTIALHHVFDSPRDAIVWDVSHGCYPHKLLTGRYEKFSTLRLDGGISGFLSPSESVHDIASTGHAGTGLSTALGIAWARCYLGLGGKVVVVVGDGSMPNGLTQEALNNTAALNLDLTVILNDNQWSIDPTPGALSKVLGSSRGGILKGQFFESLGLRYLGPVDGHDLALLVDVLKEVKSLPGPKVVHLITQKGKGYPPAEADPLGFHALPPAHFRGAGKKMRSFSSVFGEAMAELAKNNPRIVAVSAGMVEGTGLGIYRKAFPDRCFDVGIAEEHAVTFAAGLSLQGLRPVVAIYSTFLQRAYDQIVHDVCLPCLPVTFVIDRAGFVGPDGPTHHGLFDLAYLRHIPNIKVLVPSSAPELKRHLRAAIQEKGPVAIRFPRGGAPEIDFGEPIEVVVGAARTLRQGSAAAVLAVGTMVPVALEAAKILSSAGIEVEVVEARSVKPLDQKTLLDLAKRHRLLVTVEDHSVSGGFGSAVAELLSQRESLRLELVGWPDRFLEHGSLETCSARCGLDAKGLAARIESVLNDAKAGARLGNDPALPAISPEIAQRFMAEIRSIPLSEAVEEARRGYEKVGKRNTFLWKWVRRGLEITTLSCVRGDLKDFLCDTKLLGVILDVLLDDVADARADTEFLENLIAITEGKPVPGHQIPAGDRDYYLYTQRVWNWIVERVRGFPRYEELKDLLSYDYRQLMNVMRYSTLVNHHPAMMNPVEHDLYLPHNMHMMVSGTLDLMCSPDFDIRELGRLRQVIWYAQQMGRIGNLVSTWEREIKEKDYSSGIFGLGLVNGVLTLEDLEQGDAVALAEKIRQGNLEAHFLCQWKDRREKIQQAAETIQSVDVGALVRGLEMLIQLHLGSRGLK